MKAFISFLFLCISLNVSAQCPYIAGVLADAELTGTPTGEGKNEFVAFNTGGSSVALNTVYLSYSVNTTSTNFAIDGTAAAPSVWTSLITPGLIYNSSGTVTVVTSGSIPANKNVVVIASTNAVSYDLKTFGTDVYVLPYNSAAGSPRIVSYLNVGNFANSGGTPRYLRIRQGATCRDTVSYIPSSLPGADGGGAKWTAAKVITYINSGSSGAVLPVNLLSFLVDYNNQQSTINWTTAGNSTASYFEIEKSTDGVSYSTIGTITAQKENTIEAKTYSFVDNESVASIALYRLKLIDINGQKTFSRSIKLRGGATLNKTAIYPNPVTEELFIESDEEFLLVRLFDFMGKFILEQKLVSGKSSLQIQSLPSGKYTLQLIGATNTEIHKIAKQ